MLPVCLSEKMRSSAVLVDLAPERRSIAVSAAASAVINPAEFGHTLELFFGRGVPTSIFARSGSKSVFRTHKYHQTAQNFETNPMGPVPGSKTHISRKKSLNLLSGVRIF